jgi:hypothetical protein
MDNLTTKIIKAQTSAGFLVNDLRQAYKAAREDAFAQLYLLDLLCEVERLESKICHMTVTVTDGKTEKN